MCRRALSRFGNNVSRATEYLISQNDNPEPEAPEEAKAEERPAPVAGIQNLFAELLRGRHNSDPDPDHDHDEEPPIDNSDS